MEAFVVTMSDNDPEEISDPVAAVCLHRKRADNVAIKVGKETGYEIHVEPITIDEELE
jgi:hypothetical protein